MTLGGAAAAGVRIIVWCKACQRQIEPDPAELAERYGVGVAVPRAGSTPEISGDLTNWVPRLLPVTLSLATNRVVVY